jgi:hypothetical protein
VRNILELGVVEMEFLTTGAAGDGFFGIAFFPGCTSHLILLTPGDYIVTGMSLRRSPSSYCKSLAVVLFGLPPDGSPTSSGPLYVNGVEGIGMELEDLRPSLHVVSSTIRWSVAYRYQFDALDHGNRRHSYLPTPLALCGRDQSWFSPNDKIVCGASYRGI